MNRNLLVEEYSHSYTSFRLQLLHDAARTLHTQQHSFDKPMSHNYLTPKHNRKLKNKNKNQKKRKKECASSYMKHTGNETPETRLWQICELEM